jgi:hypothetical protein
MRAFLCGKFKIKCGLKWLVMGIVSFLSKKVPTWI